MKIKRFFAPDIRQAIRMVREEQGPDAVILSNRNVAGGVEIVSAVDYDEDAVRQAAEPTQTSSKGGTETGVVARIQPPSRAAGHARPAKESSRQSATDGSVSPTAVVSRGRAPQAAAPCMPLDGAAAVAQEPLLQEMRQELRSLRHMMVNQLSELAWDQMARRQPERVELLRRLMNLGLVAPLCREIADSVDDQGAEDIEPAWRTSLERLAERLPVADEGILDNGGVVALVGPTGVGKTTTIAKLAARFCLRYGHRHVALVTTDCYRIGAHEQLHNYGRILDVPVRTAGDADELHSVLNGLADKRLVLVDTAGMSQRDVRLTEQLRILSGGNIPLRPYLVLSAATQRSGLEGIIPAYSDLGLEGCILTKLDEAGSLGEVFSAIIRHQLPIGFFGDGQRVPEDLHQARARVLVDRAVDIVQRNHGGIADESMAVAFGGLAVNAQLAATP